MKRCSKGGSKCFHLTLVYSAPNSKVHGAYMGPTWVLSAPDGPHEPCYQGRIDLLSILSLVQLISLLCSFLSDESEEIPSEVSLNPKNTNNKLLQMDEIKLNIITNLTS